MFETLREFCDLYLNSGYEMPGTDLVVYQGGKCVFRYMTGYSDLENKVPMTGQERCYIYSCSKVITCTAALQLWEKGLFSLDDRLSDYMPEFARMTVRTESGERPAERPILIRHLFGMSAGFSYDTRSPHLEECRRDTDGRCPTREAMKYLAKEPLLFEPGEGWKYSLCHDVLAALVEVLSGERFGEYVKKHIFDVADMPRSTFLLPEEELDTMAPQYVWRDGASDRLRSKVVVYKLGSEYESGGAGGISTVDDYIRFLECLRTGKLLKPETVALMQTNHATPLQLQQFHETFDPKKTHGYGLGVRTPGFDPRYTDFGWGGAAGAFLAIDTEHEMSLYFGTHLHQSPLKRYRPLFYRYAKAELFDPVDLKALKEKMKPLTA